MNTKVKAQNRNDEKNDPTFPKLAKFKKEILNSFPSPYRGEKDSLADVIAIAPETMDHVLECIVAARDEMNSTS